MRQIAVLLLLLAGCSQNAMPSEPATDEVVLVGECPLSLPDGSPVDCHAQNFMEATSSQRPSLADGWRCVSSWNDDDVLLERYMTPQGGLGMYWDWEVWRDDGLAFQRFAIYTDVEEGASYHVPYQPQGFVAVPEVPSADGPVEIHQNVRLLRIHAHIDGEWVQDPDNASFILDGIGGDWWWAARFDWPGGPYFVNTMHEDVEEGRFSRWEGSGWRGMIAGTEVIIDSLGRGIKYANVDLAEPAVDGCAAPLDQV